MSAAELNAFLRQVAANPGLRARLREASAADAAAMAADRGFEVTVGDLTRYKARATSWRLRDDELEVVARWQPDDQPYWWQHIWPVADLDSRTPEGVDMADDIKDPEDPEALTEDDLDEVAGGLGEQPPTILGEAG